MLIRDAWLSRYFAGGAYRLQLDEGAPIDVPPADSLVTARVPADRPGATTTLVRSGFELVDTMVLWRQRRDHAVSAGVACRDAAAPDREPVCRIAADAFQYSRFFRDSRIPRDVARRIKADWVANFFSGARGDRMIIAHEGATVLGFLLLVDRTTIDLIAVEPGHLGRGIGPAMIAHANALVGLLSAGTQLANRPSLAMYERTGFALEAASHILHAHG